MKKLIQGDMSPVFEASDQDGNTIKLSDFTGKKVLLYFYPKADTPGCTTQSCAVEEARDEFSGLGTAVIGVSPDNEKKQKKFAEKFDLKFPLLCDEDHSIAEAFGVWGEKKMYGKSYMGIIRSSFLIDETGKIIEAWYKVSPKNTVPFAKAVI
ncbi:MAG: thioredoxin-dependent thiol peroxidase [Spirochaetales bacterium]|nr:thioredoxin-dependent thiol peroxidase [Spirochaetales bacterium]